MIRLSHVPGFRTLILGATMAGGLVGLAVQSHAMMTADEFLASISEMKRICRYINEPFVIKKYNYGCGKYVCKGRLCHRIVKRKPPRRPPTINFNPETPTVSVLPESKGGKGGDNGGDNGDGGRGNGPSNNGPQGHSGAPR